MQDKEDAQGQAPTTNPTITLTLTLTLILPLTLTLSTITYNPNPMGRRCTGQSLNFPTHTRQTRHSDPSTVPDPSTEIDVNPKLTPTHRLCRFSVRTETLFD